MTELKRVEASKPNKFEKTLALPLSEIYVDPQKFQWRVSRYNKIASDAHIRTLVGVLKSTKEPFEPLLVFTIEKRFVVIDGHHRLTAYRKARWKKPIPVEVFEGTLDEARLEALVANVRDKLPLSKPEKSEAAWKLVKDDKLSKAQIVKLGLASDGTVGAMRRVRAKLIDDRTDLRLLSWVEARRLDAENTMSDPEGWIEKRAQKIVAALLKANIGQGFMRDPEVTAAALRMLNPKLPGALARQWFYDDPDLKSELADEMRRDEDTYGSLEEPEEPEKMATEL